MNEQLRHKWHEKKVYFEGINKKQLTWGEEEDKAIYPPVCCQSETGQAFSKLLCPHDPHTGVPTNSKYSLLETRPVRRKHCQKHNKPKGRDDIQEFASEARHSSVWEAIGWPLTNDYFWGWDGKEGGKRYRLAASAWANYQDISYKLPPSIDSKMQDTVFGDCLAVPFEFLYLQKILSVQLHQNANFSKFPRFPIYNFFVVTRKVIWQKKAPS